MRLARWWWRGALVAATLALAAPLWLGSGRADPLFLMPLIGLATAALIQRDPAMRRWARTAAMALLLAGLVLLSATWAASGALVVGQVALLLAAAALLGLLHQLSVLPKRRFVRILLHGLIALGWLPVGLALADAAYRESSAQDRARVLLVTSLPLVWGAGSGDVLATLREGAAPAPIYRYLSERNALRTADGITAPDLDRTDVLLLIQPRALPPHALVTIDTWVRGGGTVLWLADPLLAAEQPFPLGDPRNPDPTEPNLALLARWGLSLDSAGESADRDDDVRIATIAGPLRLRAPGRVAVTSGRCTLTHSALMAECRIGRGRAVILADADMIDAALWAGDDAAALNPFLWHSANARWLADSIARLASRIPARALAQPVWLRPALQR